ncbi:MAG: winged helix-turn-helix domain-containing protein [Candidatus Bathyarchaeia archaeon]
MRRSKLEIYEAILETLARRPLKVDSIAYKTSMDCMVVRQYLDFLTKNGLVEERFSGDKSFYAITERGKAVYRALSFQKRLDKITESIKAVSEALEALPTLKSDEKEKESKMNDDV